MDFVECRLWVARSAKECSVRVQHKKAELAMRGCCPCKQAGIEWHRLALGSGLPGVRWGSKSQLNVDKHPSSAWRVCRDVQQRERLVGVSGA